LAKLPLLNELYLHSNLLTGLVPPLPFAQYVVCYLVQGNGSKPCVIIPGVQNCNHFKCPLPYGKENCYVHC
jgi:hypothetical protein